MAIKYEVKTGSSFLNEKARGQKDLLKRDLRGMYCRKCNVDTVIRFVEDDPTHVKPVIDACCGDFEKRIDKKIGFK